MRLDFAFYVGGLETSIINLLKNGNADLEQAGMDGVKEFATYSGELDRENLINALKALAPRFPLVLVSYGSGIDKRKAATGLVDNEPIEIEHTCGFVVIVASNDLRGLKTRKSSAYKMVGEVRQLLGGVQFEIDNEGENEFLNHSPFVPAAVETIARLPDLTAYAVHFGTTFHEWMPDRTITVGNVDEILLGVEPRLNVDEENENDISLAVNLPGVSGETK